MSATVKETYDHRSNIKKNVILVTSVAVAVSAVVYLWFPFHLPPMPTFVERMVYTLRWNVLPIVVLLVMIARVSHVRIGTAQHNPFNTKDRDKVEIHVRVVQNTLEQFVVSFALQLITAAWVEDAQMRVVPIVVLLFVVGRILFWIGYLDPSYGHTQRSRGLPLTTFPNMLMAIFCTYKLLSNCIF